MNNLHSHRNTAILLAGAAVAAIGAIVPTFADYVLHWHPWGYILAAGLFGAALVTGLVVDIRYHRSTGEWVFPWSR